MLYGLWVLSTGEYAGSCAGCLAAALFARLLIVAVGTKLLHHALFIQDLLESTKSPFNGFAFLQSYLNHCVYHHPFRTRAVPCTCYPSVCLWAEP